jgi:hypothetical protein
MNTPTPEYVARALSRFVDETRTRAIDAVTNIHSRNTAAGRLESGATLIESNDEMLALMKGTMKQGAEFIFNAYEDVTAAGVAALRKFGDDLALVVAAPVVEWAEAGQGGPGERLKAQMADELKKRLDIARNAALDDFSHGMHGNSRLRKEPVVANIINNTISNSPGAVQQAGIGDFSQSAIIQNSGNLIKAIDAFLATPEFQKLDPEKRNAVADVAEALKNEAAKTQPDPGRLHRWGLRLSALTKEFGLHMAATTVWHALGAMFSGTAF